jgi:hypothetical protein
MEGSGILPRPSSCVGKKRRFSLAAAACGGGVHPCTRREASRLSPPLICGQRRSERLTSPSHVSSLRSAVRDYRAPCHDPPAASGKNVVFPWQSPPRRRATSMYPLRSVTPSPTTIYFVRLRRSEVISSLLSVRCLECSRWRCRQHAQDFLAGFLYACFGH